MSPQDLQELMTAKEAGKADENVVQSLSLQKIEDVLCNVVDNFSKLNQVQSETDQAQRISLLNNLCDKS